MILEIDIDEGDAKIDFLHPHGPRKSFNWPATTDSCYVPLSNILCIVNTPSTLNGRMYNISNDDYEKTLVAYKKLE